jgi:hypothetical protein
MLRQSAQVAHSHVRPRRHSRRGWAAGCIALLACVAVGVPAMTASEAVMPAATKSPTRHQQLHREVATARRPAQDGPDWHQVLERLSRIRALAWRRNEPRLLRRVYDPTASTLRADRARLHRYADRGLIVRGARVEFGPLRVLRRTPRSVRLRGVDQLRPVVAVRANGRRFPLPHDLPTRHTLVLRRLAGHWRIAEVQLR